MAKNKNNPDIKEILDIIPSYCEKCGAFHDKNLVELIDKNENVTIAYIRCENCLNKNIIYIVKPLNNMVNRFRLSVDLDDSEIKKFAGKESVSSDDVLNIFKLTKMENFNKAKDFIKKISNA